MKKRLFERGLSLLLALVMVLALAPVFAIEANAAEKTVNSLSELKAAFGTADRIVLGTTINVTENLTIPSNVTVVVPAGVNLVIPYDSSNTTVNAADAITQKTPAFSYANAGELASTNTLKYPGNSTAVYTVTLESGAKIEVSGVLAVGGQYSSAGGLSGQTAGLYSQINLSAGSAINVLNGGVLSTVGYILGEGVITLASGAKAYEPFLICDYEGGTYVVASFHGAKKTDTNVDNIGTENSTMPFNNYGLFNIQSRIEMVAGSNLMGYCDLYTGEAGGGMIKAQHNKTIVSVVGSSDSIFNLSNGSAVLSYTAPAGGVSNTMLGQTQFEIYGDCAFGLLALSVAPLGDPINVTTEGIFFALPYSFKMIQRSNTLKVPADIKVKMMPGAEIHIDQGATLEVERYRMDFGTLVVYDGLDTSVNNKRYPSSAALKKAGLAQHARLVVDGTMKLDGAFGGIVETTGSGTVSVGKNATLQTTSCEGVEAGWGLYVKVLWMTYDYTIKTTNRTSHTKTAQLVLHNNKYTANQPVNMEASKTYYGASAEPVYGAATYSYVFDPSGASTAKNGSYSGEVEAIGSWAVNTGVVYDNGESLRESAPVAAAGEVLTYYTDYTFTTPVAKPATTGVAYYKLETCEHPDCKHVGIDEENHGYICSACGMDVVEAHNWVDGNCTVCGFGQFNVDATTDRVVMIDAPSCAVAVAACYKDGKMVTSAVNNDGKTAFVLTGLESGMTVKVFLLDANYAPIDGYVPSEEVAK